MNEQIDVLLYNFLLAIIAKKDRVHNYTTVERVLSS